MDYIGELDFKNIDEDKILEVLIKSDKINDISWRFKHRIEAIILVGRGVLAGVTTQLLMFLLHYENRDASSTEVTITIMLLAMSFSVFRENHKSTKYNYIKFLRFLRENFRDRDKIHNKIISHLKRSEKSGEGYCAEQGLYLAIRDIFGKNSPEIEVFQKLKKKYSKNSIPNF